MQPTDRSVSSGLAGVAAVMTVAALVASAVGMAPARVWADGPAWMPLDEPPAGLSAYVTPEPATVPSLATIHTTPTGEVPSTVSREQALADIDLAERYLQVGYSGYQFFLNEGFDFDGLFRSLRAWVATATCSSTALSVDELTERLGHGLQPLRDRHLAVGARRWYRACPHARAYFADLVVERAAGGGADVVVVQSRVEGIGPGMRYTGPAEHLFPTLARPGADRCLVGTLATTPPASVGLAFDGSLRDVAVHPCRLTRYNSTAASIVATSVRDGITFVSATSFAPKNDEEQRLLGEFAMMGRALVAAPLFVLDLCGNSGGSDRYISSFVRRLDGGLRVSFTAARLESPLLGQPRRRWTYRLPQTLGAPGGHAGRVVVLTNKAVGSAAEVGVHLLRNLRSVVLVGENTSGIEEFGGAGTFILPHSQIRMSISSLVKPEAVRPEGLGYRPDYWVDKDDPRPDVAAWLASPETYEYRLP